jgi:ribosomal protein S18 acetylase RimI-like enzyme
MNSISQKNIRSYSWNDAHYWQAIKIRRIVLRFPLGKNYSNHDFEAERTETFFGIFNVKDHCIGTISAKDLGNNTWKMRQFAIHPSFQNKGLGKKMVRHYEKEARKKGIEIIEFHARKTAVEFYRKLGYNVVSDEFLEVEIPHYKMKKVL